MVERRGKTPASPRTFSALKHRNYRLFITGQDIGWELNGEGPDAVAWYHDYLGANYVADSAADAPWADDHGILHVANFGDCTSGGERFTASVRIVDEVEAGPRWPR